jgi:hypothetical protein
LRPQYLIINFDFALPVFWTAKDLQSPGGGSHIQGTNIQDGPGDS